LKFLEQIHRRHSFVDLTKDNGRIFLIKSSLMSQTLCLTHEFFILMI